MRTLTSLLAAVADIIRLDLSAVRFDVDADAVTADLMHNQS